MISTQDIKDFIAKEFPQAGCEILSVGTKTSRVRKSIGFDDLRPGGTVSGPVLMSVADFSLYVAILGEIGIVPLALTTSFNINFLRKPTPNQDIIGQCNLMKVGKKLIIGDVYLYSEGDTDPVAHAVGTYSVPPENISSTNE